MKKILSILCALAITLAMLPGAVLAADDAANPDALMLDALGAYPTARVSSNSFIMALAGLMYDDPAKEIGNAEAVGRAMGMIEEDEDYSGGTNLTPEKAVKYAVIALGYKIKATEYGGDAAAYRKVAAEIGISAGIDYSAAKMSEAQAILLMKNVMEEAPLVSYYANEVEFGYKVATGETLLSLNRNIYKIQGIVTANNDTSLYSQTGVYGDVVRIGETEYETKNKAFGELLGNYVDAYIKNDGKNEPQLIYAYENAKKNNVLTLTPDQELNMALDYSQIDYTDPDNVRRQKAKIDAVPRVIYNGVYYPDYLVGDFNPNVGDLRLIDNDNDGKYEVIFINDYRTMVVSAIDPTNETISSKYSFAGSISTLDLDPADRDISYSIYKDGEEVNFSAIAVGDVLSVAISRDAGAKKVKVVISSAAKIEGLVNSQDTTLNTVTINGKEYKKPADFMAYLVQSGKTIVVGNTYEFEIDAFGNLAYVSNPADTDLKLFLKTYDSDEKYYVVYMDLSGEWTTTTLAKSVKVDTTNHSTAYAAYTAISGKTPQMVKLKTNSKGEIREIDFANPAGNPEVEFSSKAEGPLTYRQFPMEFEPNLFMTNNTKIVMYPNTPSTDKADYTVITSLNGFLRADNTYTCIPYITDTWGSISVLMIKETGALYSAQARNTSKYYIVTKIMDVAVGDEVLKQVSFTSDDAQELTVFTDSLTFQTGSGTKTLAVGDFVRVATDARGYLTGVDGTLNLTSFSATATRPAFSASTQTYNAYAVETNAELQKVRIKFADNSEQIIPIENSTVLVEYDHPSRQMRKITLGDIKQGDKLIIENFQGRMQKVLKVVTN